MEQTITISSNRFYIPELLNQGCSPDDLASLEQTFYEYNIMVEWAYNRMYDAKYLGKPVVGTLTKVIQDEYTRRFRKTLSAYYVTSIYSRASGMLSSQRELFKLQEREWEERQAGRREKVEELKADLDKFQKIKKLLIERSRSVKYGRPFDDSLFLPHHLRIQDHKMMFRSRNRKMAALDLYLYEVYLDRKIKRTKSGIAMIEEKIRTAEAAHRAFPGHLTFGGRGAYRKKDTLGLTGKDLELWHKERDRKRFRSVSFSGRHTSSYGNYQCRYEIRTNEVSITLLNGTVLTVKGVTFPYRFQDLVQARSEKRSVGYILEQRTDGHGNAYYLLKAGFTVENPYINTETCDGVIAVDLNYDHIALAELDHNGCLLRTKVFHFDPERYNSGQFTSVLGSICKEIMSLCASAKKPLVMEDISLHKGNMAYKGKRRNRHISMFAYKKIQALLYGQALQRSVGILLVNPAYTSMYGKIKYMKVFGISVHCAASYMIGRRGMGYRERLPKCLHPLCYHKNSKGVVKNLTASIRSRDRRIYKNIRSIPTHVWYQNIQAVTWKGLNALCDLHCNPSISSPAG